MTNKEKFYQLNIQPYNYVLANPNIDPALKKRILDMIEYWKVEYMGENEAMASGGKIEYANGHPVKKSKYNLGDKVYSWQNKDYPAEVVKKHFSAWYHESKPHENDTWKYVVKLKDGQRSKWMSEQFVFKTKQKEYAEGGEITEPNPTDTINMDVPLFIRTLEYAKEDAKTDMDLHRATENAIDLSKSEKTLTMKDYDSIVNVDNKNNTQTCNCPTMSYHNRLTEEAKEKLGNKYLGEGSTITDGKTGVVSEIAAIDQHGFNLANKSSFDGAPRVEFHVPFEELVEKHNVGHIKIDGYGDTPEDHNVLILVVKDIMAGKIINGQSEKIKDMSDTIEDGVVEEVEFETMASGGVIGEIKASRRGRITEVRDTDGKLLEKIYVKEFGKDELYQRDPTTKAYFNDQKEVLYEVEANKIHLAYGGIVGVETLPNFYRVDIASPRKVQTCRVPGWAQNVAESAKEGAKVTTCKAHGKWFLSSVLVPKDGIESGEAKHIATEIKNKIEHKKMDMGGVVFETGATSPKVDNLILFADNTRNLAEMRDAVYATIESRIKNGGKPTKQEIADRFKTFFLKTKGQYIREMGNTEESRDEVSLTPSEEKEFLNIYMEEFPIWLRERRKGIPSAVENVVAEIYGRKYYEGGKMAEIDYDVIRALKYWGELKTNQRLHFLLDHADEVFGKALSEIPKKELTEYKKLASANWKSLPKEVQLAVEGHVIMGTYENGGELSGYTAKDEAGSKQFIGDDMSSAAKAILILIDCTEDPAEKERLREQLKQYDYQAN